MKIDPTRFAFFEKKILETEDTEEVKEPLMCQFTGQGAVHIRRISGMWNEEHTLLHKHIGMNQFDAVPVPVPTGYERETSPSEEWIKNYFYNPRLKYVTPKQVPEYDQEHYFTHHNGDRPLLVYIRGNVATVYKIPNADDDYYLSSEYADNYALDRRPLYHKQVCQITFTQSFIGQSPPDDMTLFGGGHGPRFAGNTLLLQVNGLDYVQIATTVRRFTALSPIVEYQSSVGNNDVPYPFALDDADRVYLMLEGVIMKRCGEAHPYHVYYGMSAFASEHGLSTFTWTE